MSTRSYFVFLLLAMVLGAGARSNAAGQGTPVGRLGDPDVGVQREGEADLLFNQAVLLGVPAKELDQLVEVCQRSGFTGAEVSRMLSLVTRAKLAGLPHADLLNKLREGLAKGVAPDTVLRAVDDKARTLRRAKELVDTLLVEGWTAPDQDFAIQLVADALEAGASPAEILCSVRENRPCGHGVPDPRAAFGKLSPRR